ncbi:MAG: hypothetical protein AXW15_12910 [Neptuniibacter sp. Phe_28]|nr:MAG: hypothetical protein AXW15_12910 [Neptuniibacter sp. Phe_28]
MSTFVKKLNSFEGTQILASTYSPVIGRMARDLGFKYGMIGGSVASMSTIASPDLMLLTSSELCDLVRRTCQASDLQVVVDGDGGYGNALNVMRTVRDLEMAGAAAVTLEDTSLPISYQQRGAQLISVTEQVDKLKAALDVRCSDSFGIIARTQVLHSESSDSLRSRVSSYASAGADMICIAGQVSGPELEIISEAAQRPIMMITYGQSHTFNDEFLIRNSVKLLLTGHTPFESAMRASYDALRELAGIDTSVSDLSYSELMRKHCNQPLYDNAMKKYLGIVPIND